MLLILFSFSFAGLLLCHRCFTADRNCDEYPCTQNLAGNHSNCCVVALNHLTLGGRLPGQSRVEIPCTFSLSLCLRFTHTHVHARTHTHRQVGLHLDVDPIRFYPGGKGTKTHWEGWSLVGGALHPPFICLP